MATHHPRRTAALLALLAVSLAACGTAGAPPAPRAPSVAPAARATASPFPTATRAPSLPSRTPTRAPSAPARTPTLVATERPPLPAGFEVLDPTRRYPEHARRARELLPQALAYLERRTGERLRPPLTLVLGTIREGDRCAVRGLALPGARQIYLYVSDDMPASQFETGLAHELAHVLHEQAAGGAVGSATLAEGFATYAEGRYWPAFDERSGFQDAVRRLRREGRYIPLTRSDLPCDTDTRDRIYTERAAFVEWLLETHGRPRFWRINRLAADPAEPPSDSDELPYLEPPVIRRNPSYEAAPWERVYDSTLPELEREWLASLRPAPSP